MYAKVAKIHFYGTRIMALCALIIALSAFLYGIFLLMAVERTAARSTAESSIQALSGHLAELQSQYLSETQALTPGRAAELGFVTPKKSDTLFAQAPSRTLSFENVGR